MLNEQCFFQIPFSEVHEQLWSKLGNFPTFLWLLFRVLRKGQILEDLLWNSNPICLAVKNGIFKEYWVKSNFSKCCRWPCLGKGVELKDLQRSFPIYTIQWFCDSAKECDTKPPPDSLKRAGDQILDAIGKKEQKNLSLGIFCALTRGKRNIWSQVWMRAWAEAEGETHSKSG